MPSLSSLDRHSHSNRRSHSHSDKKIGRAKKTIYSYHEVADKDECNLFMSIAALLVGVGAGIVIHMYPVYLPTALKDSFIFRDYIFYKLIFSALTVNLFVTSLYSICRQGISRPWAGNGFFSSGIGALILGAGMALCKSDPFLLFVQLGTATESSLYTVAGCLLGALTWGMIYDAIPRDNYMIKPQYIDGFCKGKVSYSLIAMPLSLFFGVFLIYLEYLTNYEEIEIIKKKPISTSVLYSPYFVGFCLALLQFPLSVIFTKSLQGFCSWIACVAFPMNQIGKMFGMRMPGYIRFTGSYSASWSILMGLGVFFGSVAAGAFQFKNAYWIEDGPEWYFAMLGGFLMIVGSIFCGGDAFTLIGGIANLHLPSYINFGMMLLGACGMSQLIKIL